MILVDPNLLVYAHASSLPQHRSVRTRLDEKLNGMPPVGLPWPSLLAFARLVTNPRVFQRPAAPSAAWSQVESWLDCTPAWIPLPTDRHREVLGPLLASTAGRANLLPDAHLAALALEHGPTVCSTDRDFARFPGVRWENPRR